MRLFLAGPSNETDIYNRDQQRTLNWYLDLAGGSLAPEKYPAILQPTPGIISLLDYGDFDKGRGSLVYRDVAYVVLDDTLAILEDDSTLSYIDLLNTSTGAVVMFGGTDGIIMTDGTNAYFYDVILNVFSVIDTSGLISAPIGCTFYDGYYILVCENTDRVYYSLDPITWDPLGYNSANSSFDYLTACYADHEELWLFGTNTVEVWYTTGDEELPLARKPGVLLTKGCRAPNTIVALDNTFYWLGTDAAGGYQVYSANGYNAVLVSGQRGLTTQIAKMTTVTDAYAFSHRIGEHQFYVITFPTENVTWAYDITTQQWHERASMLDLAPTDEDYEPLLKAHRAKNYFYVNGKHYVLDQYSGAVAAYDVDTFTEFDQPILRQRRTSQLTADTRVMGDSPQMYNNQLHTYYNFRLNMESDVSLSSGQGSDPQVMLSISTDGGRTWQYCGSKSFGVLGSYSDFTCWEILGQAREMVFDISVTDPVNAVLLGGTVEVVKDTN